MRRRFLYWPVSVLPFLTVITLSIALGMVGDRWDDVYAYCYFGLLVGYGAYFNYPSLREGFRSLIGQSKDKSIQEGQERIRETKLASKYLGERDNTEYFYEFLGPIRFVSDHLVYRILTLVYVAIFILLIILNYYFDLDVGLRPAEPLQHLIRVSILVSGLVAYTSIFRFTILKRTDYPYYLAKAYFALSKMQAELSVGLRYFVEGMEAYNQFLQRDLKLKIRDLQSFYSLLSSDEVGVQKDTVKKLYLSFHQEGQNLDKLEPYRQINNIMYQKYKKEIQTGVSRRKTLEEWIPVLALVTSTVIAILQIYVK